jgi:YVTN family beta-propeller protein
MVWPRLRGMRRIFSLGVGPGELKRIVVFGVEAASVKGGIGSPAHDRETTAKWNLLRAARDFANAPRGWLIPAALACCSAVAGCGGQYRPVVTPITPTGPASQPQTFVIVTTKTGANSPGLANVFDGAGDTLLTQATLAISPLSVALNPTGSPVLTANTDGTLNSYDPSASLRSNLVFTSTLLPPGKPYNMINTTNNLFVTMPNVAAAAVLKPSGNQYSYIQQLPLAASPVNFAGNANAQRIYAISQDNGSNKVAFGNCETPSQVTTPGQVAAIETSTLTISNILPVGICPVYGISSTDNLRTYILNRGSGTVTVINSQLNQLDNFGTVNLTNEPYLTPATGTLTLPAPAGFTGSFNAGPVYADYLASTSQLVTANYDSNTISIINVTTDIYGNDAPIFGQTVTVPVGNGPAALTILRDGSRVYVANQKDSTVSVVNLTTFQVEATIAVTGHPISIASLFSTPFSQVYVIPSDQPYMTVIRTDTDQVSAAVQLDGNGMDVHAGSQSAGATSSTNSSASAINISHASGSGAPCGYGAAYYQQGGPCSSLGNYPVSTF